MSLHPVPAMSNVERQRQFRECNPGYYARLQAARRGSIKRALMRLNAATPATEPAQAPAVAPQAAWEAPLGC